MQSEFRLTELVDKVAGAVARFDVAGQRMAVTLYRLLSEGEPVSVRRLAAMLNLPDEAVRNALEAWPIFFDDRNAVIGFGGLTVVEMPPHRFIVDGRSLYAWCAWDSLFIPAVLGKVARVESICPVTGASISLVVGPTGVREVRPNTAVVSFLTPERTFDRNVIVNFCHFVHFFRDAEAAAQWIGQHPGTFLLSVDDAFTLGQLTNARNFGDALDVQVARGV
ncbi:MAG TPA: organomercurial lyase [Candidatus Methylomirabilis sp.]|nr:organomercurial lyase [Candidatus Methylomirabilis sp.]